MKVNQAFILAAGLGKRMKPITNTIPKPMVEVKGKSIITRVIDQLLEYGVQKIVINSFYKAEQLKEHVDSYIESKKIDADVQIIKENELLETGGGIINALPYLDNKPFFVVNSDSIWNGQNNPFEYLQKQWDPKMHSLFLLQKTEEAIGYDHTGDFDLNEKGVIIKPENKASLPYAYAGIHITKPQNFTNLKVEHCKLMEIYNKCKGNNVYQNIYGAIYPGHWFHVGTPEAIRTTEEMLMKKLT